MFVSVIMFRNRHFTVFQTGSGSQHYSSHLRWRRDTGDSVHGLGQLVLLRSDIFLGLLPLPSQGRVSPSRAHEADKAERELRPVPGNHR